MNDIENNYYKFSSYEIYLNSNVNYIERRYDTILRVISEFGAIKTGLMVLFGLVLSKW